MSKTVPIDTDEKVGVIRAVLAIAEAEGIAALYLGTIPRLVLVSTGGALYFWSQEVVHTFLQG